MTETVNDTDINDFDDFEGGAKEQRAELRERQKQAALYNLKRGGLFWIGLLLLVGGGFAYNHFTSPDGDDDIDVVPIVTGTPKLSNRTTDVDADDLSKVNAARIVNENNIVSEARATQKTYIGSVALEESAVVVPSEETAVDENEAVTTTDDITALNLPTVPVPTPDSTPSYLPEPAKTGSTQTGNTNNDKRWSVNDEVRDAKNSAKLIEQELISVRKAATTVRPSSSTVFVSAPDYGRDDRGDDAFGYDNSDEFDEPLPIIIDESGNTVEDRSSPVINGPTKRVTLNQGEKLLAFVTVGYDSDAPGPIEIEIVTPPLDGAIAIDMNPKVVGENVIAEFSTVSYKGVSYPVNAVMINSESLRQGYVDDVDTHFFERWIPFLIAGYASGYSDSLRSGTSTINADGDEVTENDRIDDSEDRWRFAAGKALDRTLPRLERQIDRPATLTIDNFSQVGIWFLEGATLEVRK